jgi:lipopolysaccharide exporter
MGIALAPMIMLAIAAPEVTSLLLGKAWYTAGELVRYLAPSLLLAFIASPLSEVYTIFERQSEKLVFNVAVFLTRLAALVVGGLLGDAIVAIILYSVAGCVFWMLQCFWLLRMCKIKTSTILRHIVGELAMISPLIIFVGGVQYLYNSPTKILLALLIGMALFGAWRWKEFLGPGVANITGRAG